MDIEMSVLGSDGSYEVLYPVSASNLIQLSQEMLTNLGLSSGTLDNVLTTVVPSIVPVGSVFWYCNQNPPVGFLTCDGSAISRTNYSQLFAVIGTNFGKGNGSTTFSLPDLRALFIRGSGNQGGYSATFAKKQEASIVYAGAPYQVSGYLSVTVGNADKVERFSNQSRSMYGNGGPNANSNINYIRPYNIALTPIIKY